MTMPYVNSVQTSTAAGNNFQGLRRDPFGNVNFFWDMRNMTGNDAPIIRTRDKRYKVRTISNCNGIFGREKIGWVDGKALWYDGQQIGNLKTADAKTFVHMGAYTLIFPDKMLFHTVDKTIASMENVVTCSSVTYTACDILGEDADAASAIYVRIEGTGVGAGFKSKDVVEISGSVQDTLNGTLQIQLVMNDDTIVVLATMDQSAATSQKTKLTISRTVPDMDFVTESENRIWGCSSANHEIYACKLGDPTNWHNYQGLADDAYAVTVGSTGNFTGAVTHLGYVYFFKEHMHHKLFGNKPANYQLTSTNVRGVEHGSEKSLCILNETLYYHSVEGMCLSNGALPQAIDEALGRVKYKNVKCGAAKGKLWAAMERTAGGHEVLVYDDDTGIWHKEDDAQVLAFAQAGNELYMVTTDGAMWCMTGEGSENLRDSSAQQEGAIDYAVETGDLQMADLYRKRLQKIHLRLTLDANSTCDVLVQYDGGEWKKLYAMESGKDLKSKAIPFVPRRCDRMRIRLQGKGMMRLYNINTITTGGSDIG